MVAKEKSILIKLPLTMTTGRWAVLAQMQVFHSHP